ncbi:tripartite tricarboxylate transporter substrate binding protein [Jiella sp. MQZ9-1]|uniref:Tripartite tricarboxylate transporter substrate binding protein n=1 Tax=Jiella flava TaxID=2816857 RepID=A0A939FZL5_9HYPH|nr:tripartite tricarboxylate transporter substrate binding protein [Jiella flava]MBO0663130.1 tripartite tricarboxylate transporter substrate binding protein [Jiella flava]MCD2471549.1 tripartite tricarboxylate transporter substrate binding protein [Jiella flava]
MKIITLAAIGVALSFSTSASAQTVEMIVPFSAGGGTDSVARVFEPGFSEALGQTTVIRNVAGASGTIGAAATADAANDGSTIGYLPIGPLAIQPSLRKTSYNADSFSYICQTTSTPVFLLEKKGSEMKSVKQWVERGKAKRIVYGSSGPGTIPHLAMAAFAATAGLKAVHLPFKGTGPAMNAMAGGEIDLFADTATVLEGNDVTALAVFAPERLKTYPDIPTMKELGYDLDFSVWQGLVAPKGLPKDLQQKYAEACQKAIATDRFKSLAEKTNTGIKYRGPDAFEAFVAENTKKNRKILAEAGLVK